MAWLESAVRAAMLQRIGLAVAAIAVIGGILFMNQRYLENNFAGPYAIPKAELSAATSADQLPRYWVRMNLDRVLDTGIDHITIRTRKGVERGRDVTGHYWVGVVGDRLLTVISHGTTPTAGTEITGYLKTIPADLMGKLTGGQRPEVQKAFLPILLETESFDSNGTMGLWAAGIASAGALLFGLLSLRRYFAPSGHKALTALTGSGVSLADASASIESDIGARQYVKTKNYKLTSGYAVKTGFSPDVKPLAGLLWAYPITTQNKIYGIIPTTKSHSVDFTFRTGKFTEPVGKDASTRVMDHLGRFAPWTFLGYSDDLAAAIAKQRPMVEAAVDQRRMAVMQAATAGPAEAAHGTA